MGSRLWFPVFILLFSSCSEINGDQEKNVLVVEKEILDNILNSTTYDHRVRPVQNNDILSPTQVFVNMYVRTINKVDDIKMQFSVQITLRQKWLDPRLKYNNMNGKLKYLNLFEEKIWTPDLFISNERSGYINNLMKPNTFVRIFPDGHVLYSSRVSLVLSCPMNLKLFPFDRQACTIRMASYGYTTDDIVFVWDEVNPVQIVNHMTLPQYMLDSHTTDYCNSKTSTGSYSCLKADFLLKRLLNFYMLHLFIPSILLVMTSWIVFWLDIQNIMTRVFVTLSTLLVLGFKLSDFNATLTPVSYTRSVDVWSGTCMIFVFAALLEVMTVDYRWREQQKKQRRATGVLDTTEMQNEEAIDLKPLVSNQNSSAPENRAHANQVGRLRNYYSRLVSNLPAGPKKMDVISRLLFPISFTIFNIFYWLINLTL